MSIALLAACSGRAVDLDSAQQPAGPVVVDTTVDGDVQRTDLTYAVSWFSVDAGRVFWQSVGAYSCDFERCNETRVQYSVNQATAFLTVGTADHVYFSIEEPPMTGLEKKFIARCPTAGCNGAPEFFAVEEASGGWGFGFDAGYVYWQSAYDVLRCPRTGCGDIPELVAHNQTGQDTIQVGADSVFYIPYDPENPDLRDLRSAPKDGSAPPKTLAVIDGTTYSGFAAGASAVYWIESTGKILSCPFDGCGGAPPSVLVDTSTIKSALRVDDVGIYWLESPDSSARMGGIRFCPLAGCPAGQEPRSLVASGPVIEFLLDGPYIYWNEYVANPDATTNSMGLPQGNEFLQTAFIYRMPRPQRPRSND